MKDITNILRKSDITPYDRVKLLVENSLHFEKTGENLLADSDLFAISENWTPKNSAEVSQYNKYLHIAKARMSMYLDAGILYLQSENSILKAQNLIDYIRTKKINASNLGDLGLDNTDEAKRDNLEYLLNNTHLSYSNILQNKTFLSLPKDIRDDLLLLDESVQHDSRYLDDHILLYELYKDTDKLSENQKNILFEKIYERINQKNMCISKLSLSKYSFFAELATEKIILRCADYLNIKYDKTDKRYWDNLMVDIKRCSSEKNISVKELFQEIICKWIDDGLFVKEYTLLCKSESRDTWTKPTNRKHCDLFFIWLKKLQETKVVLDKLFNDGDLVKNDDQITGSSLYYSKLNVDFVLEYKDQVNHILPMVSIIKFIKNDIKPISCYKTFCEFVKLAQKVSDIFDIDVSNKFIEYKSDYYNQVILLNMKFARFLDDFYENNHKERKWKYEIEINPDAFYFDTQKECESLKIIQEYDELIKEDC
ncbi:MAG TPA: hypothetical protein PKD85_01565 [Saprospiraceae bacterium]|nr:hypothetical protein [Saprospiraceae bacterium]